MPADDGTTEKVTEVRSDSTLLIDTSGAVLATPTLKKDTLRL